MDCLKPTSHFDTFRLIIGTIKMPCNGRGKVLISLIRPLTQNEYAAEDSSEAAAKII